MNNFWRNKKVLVTGGLGFIGSHAVETLLKNKAVVTVVVSPQTPQKEIAVSLKTVGGKIKIIRADLTLLSDCVKTTQKQEIVLNFAAMDGGLFFKQTHAAEIFRANTQIAGNILEASRLNKVERVLVMSSVEVYSDSCLGPIKEDCGFSSEVNEKNAGYVWSKRVTELLAKMYFKQYGLKIAIARAGSTYGPRDYFQGEKERIIPVWVHKALKDQNLEIFDCSVKKQFIYVTDLVNNLLNLVEKYPVCDPVNISGAQPILLKELAQLIISLTKSKAKIICLTDGKSQKNKIVSVQKAKTLIDFKEEVSLEGGLKTIITKFPRVPK